MRRDSGPSSSPDALLWDDSRLATPHVHADKADRVRKMFDAIAPTYELVNSVFSAGRDRAWRRRMVALARPTANDRLIDIACGTGDVARTFATHIYAPHVIVGCDFADNMLALAAKRGPAQLTWSRADALELPFADGSFSIASCAFGVRNFQDLDRGLREMHRVLAPGGRAVILEFSRPSNRVFRMAYELYSAWLMPVGAALVSGDRTGAYRYLPHSVVSFPDPAAMARRLREAGFDAVAATPMTFGVVTIYVAVKSRHDRTDAPSRRR